jgi:hypothetical protein
MTNIEAKRRFVCNFYAGYLRFFFRDIAACGCSSGKIPAFLAETREAEEWKCPFVSVPSLFCSRRVLLLVYNITRCTGALFMSVEFWFCCFRRD